MSEDYICHVDRDLLEFAESHYATSPELVCVKVSDICKADYAVLPTTGTKYLGGRMHYTYS